MKSTGWGARIKAMREERGWSQEQLAEIAGVSERTIQRLEQEEPARFDSLRALAAAFKLDVKDLLGSAKPIEKPQDEPQVSFLLRIRTGADLFKVVGGAHAGSFDHDELKEEKQVELVASFAQDVHDYADIWQDVEPGERVRVAHGFNARIAELEEDDLWVFAMRQRRRVVAPETKQPFIWETAIVQIVHAANPEIVSVDLTGEALPRVGLDEKGKERRTP